MITREYLNWFSFMAATVCATVMSAFGDCQNYVSVSCTNSEFYTGCTRGNWTVTCNQSGTNCVVSSGYCYQVTVVGGSCGDCCADIPGSGLNCVITATNQLPVTVITGTPSCPLSCPTTAYGSCINRQPLPGNWTYPFYETTDHSCGG